MTKRKRAGSRRNSSISHSPSPRRRALSHISISSGSSRRSTPPAVLIRSQQLSQRRARTPSRTPVEALGRMMGASSSPEGLPTRGRRRFLRSPSTRHRTPTPIPNRFSPGNGRSPSPNWAAVDFRSDSPNRSSPRNRSPQFGAYPSPYHRLFVRTRQSQTPYLSPNSPPYRYHSTTPSPSPYQPTQVVSSGSWRGTPELHFSDPRRSVARSTPTPITLSSGNTTPYY